MNKSFVRRGFSLVLTLVLMLSLFAGLSLTASAEIWNEQPTGYTKASDVKYVKVGNYIANWGVRGEVATFLTSYAENYYTGSYTFEKLSGNQGNANINSTPSSQLYKALSAMMNAKSTSTTSYAGTRDLYKYTDCMVSNYSYISSFYSGTKLTGAWDSGKTWNREHTWPNSKISNNGENDIMMLRPTSVQENSDRGNKAYGESSGFYNPNAEANGKFNLHGDCARIILYVYVRWGVTDTMWGSSGVMENLDVLLKWMEEDPVDTWELGRNDAVQSITGVRNAFVDYPEFAWLLFGQKVPAGYQSPSGSAIGAPHTHECALVEAVDATCTKPGNIAYLYCAGCGKYFSYEKWNQQGELVEISADATVIPALDHDLHYQDNGDGTHTVTCSRGDYSATEDCTYESGVCVYCNGQEVQQPDPDKQIEFIDIGNVWRGFDLENPMAFTAELNPDEPQLAEQMEIADERWTNLDTETVYQLSDGENGPAVTAGTYVYAITLKAKTGYVFAERFRFVYGGSEYTPTVERSEDGKQLTLTGFVENVVLEEAQTTGFVDLKDNAFYLDAVAWAVENNVTTGVDATHFDPDGTCTRAQVVTFLWRAAGEPEPTGSENPFVDVTGGYYYKAVLWAVENEITAGMDATHFNPEGKCTRGQVVTFLWRAAGKPELSKARKTSGEDELPIIPVTPISEEPECPFTDVNAKAYYYEAMLWAVENGITKGTSATTFAPNDTCTRGQVVTFLYRAEPAAD